MESGRTITGRFSLAVVMVAALVLAVGMPGQASAATCTDVGGVDVGGNCTISTPITAICPFNLTVPGDLLITSTGSINCSDSGVPPNGASPITISVGGDMEMQAGSSIRAENTNDGGNGGNITLTVGGNFTMRGTSGGSPGAVISSSKTGRRHRRGREHSDHGRQCHGQPGRPDHHVRHDARAATSWWRTARRSSPMRWRGGHHQDVCGQERHDQRPGVLAWASWATGGAGRSPSMPAVISSSATRARSSAGAGIPAPTWCICRAVSSRSSGSWRPPGPAHEPPFANLCNVNRPGKPLNSGACVEIWAGTTLEIDSTGTPQWRGQRRHRDVGRHPGPELDRPPGEWRHHHPGQCDAGAGGGQQRHQSRLCGARQPVLAERARRRHHGHLDGQHGDDDRPRAAGQRLHEPAMAARAGRSSCSPPAKWPLAPGRSAAFVEAAGDTTGGAPKGGTITRSRSTAT